MSGRGPGVYTHRPHGPLLALCSREDPCRRHGSTPRTPDRRRGLRAPGDRDQKLDNIVRSEARRLRAKLDIYAESASPDETVPITMPNGGYAAGLQDLKPDVMVNPRNDAVVPAAAVLNRPSIERQSTLLLAASIAIAVASVFLFSVCHRRAVQAKTENFEIVPFSTEVGQQFSPSISPDGTRIAFVWNGDGSHFNISLKPVAGGAPVRLTEGPTTDLHPFWSPDGSRIAFLRESASETDLIVKNLTGGVERILRHMRDPLSLWSSVNAFSGCQSPSWTSDGKQIVLTDALNRNKGSGLVSIFSTTGEEKVITFPPGEDQDCYSRVSPDGKTIAFVRYLSHWVGDIYTIDGNGGNLKRVTFDSRDVRGLDWTSDGRQIVFASRLRGSYELRVIDRNGGQSTLVPTDTASIADPTVSSKGRFIAFVESEENWNIWRASIKDGQVGKAERFLGSSGQNHSPSFSPDGRTIAFVSDRSGNPEVWFSDSDGMNLRQRTHFGGPWLGTIRWAPDGSTIVFDARPNGHSAIFTMSVAGGAPKPFQREDFEVRRPSWSRDGKSIYFDSTRDGKPGIWKRNLQTGETSSIAPAGSLQSLESLDGGRLFFAQTETHDLWMSNTDGSNAMKLEAVHPNPDLDWALGPGNLYYVASRGSFTDVFAYHLASRQLQNLGQLTQTLSPGTPSLAVSPDGQWLLYAVIDHIKSDIRIRKEETMNESRK
jgi:Tol biopolymer transport system component